MLLAVAVGAIVPPTRQSAPLEPSGAAPYAPCPVCVDDAGARRHLLDLYEDPNTDGLWEVSHGGVGSNRFHEAFDIKPSREADPSTPTRTIRTAPLA